MNGIEMGNILANTAMMRQKDSRAEQAETQNVHTEQNGREEIEKNGKTSQPPAGSSDSVLWVRNGSERSGTASTPGTGKYAVPWNMRGNHYGAGRQGGTNTAGLWNMPGNRHVVNNTNRTHLNGQKEIGQAGQNAQKGIGQANQNTQKGIGQANQNAQKGIDQANQNTQKGSVQAGKNAEDAKNGIGQTAQTNQTGIGTNRIGQTNSLNPVNRQRLAQQKKAKAAAKKKNLNYNRREVSSQVLRANKIGSAARALATARTKVSTLRRCVGTGQYDENELRIAINHAESIVKTAKKKVANLKEEQIKEKRVAREKQTNSLKKQVKKQRIREKRQQVKREMTAQRKQAERQTKMKELRCKLLKRRHRGEELSDVLEADIKYIKDMDRYRRYGVSTGSKNAADTTGATAHEIGDSAMQLSDLQRTEQALKYEEQQMNQETASFSGSSASGSMDISVGDTVSGGGSGGADPGAAAADLAAVGSAVDISL